MIPQDKLAEYPDGTISAERFAWEWSVSHDSMRYYIIKGLKRAKWERIEAVEIPWRGRIWRFLTPNQQKAALAYWKKYKVFHFSQRGLSL